MSTFFQSVTTHWTDIIGYALVEYVTDNILAGPLSAMGMGGRYLASGVDFALKQAVAVTKPLSSITSWRM